MARVGAVLRHKLARWWPLGYVGLIGFTLGATWTIRSVSELHWLVTCAWAMGLIWFLVSQLARLTIEATRRRLQSPAARPESLVPEQRVTRENELGPYWLN